jgi:uncharacterized SAM-binding protein YcdF (DUF218 family)
MKFLINPLFGFLLIQIVGALLLLRYRGFSRRLPWLILLAALCIAVLAMPMTKRSLETSLEVDVSGVTEVSPTYIFVLGGGYQVGINLDEDFLIHESMRRVLHGIVVWNHHQDAKLVLSGMTQEKGRPSSSANRVTI